MVSIIIAFIKHVRKLLNESMEQKIHPLEQVIVR